MEFGFTSDQDLLRKSVREVLAERSTSQAIRKVMKGKTGIDAALWSTVGELGWPGVAIEESEGGLGLGLIELAILSEEMGRAVAPVPFFSTVAFAAQVVAQAPASALRSAVLKSIAAGESKAAVALGQKEGRYDAGGIAVKAARTESGSWKFSGAAALVPDAHLADQIVVVARTARAKNPEEGVSLFVVPASALKSKPKPQASLDGTRRLADVKLGGVEVGDDAMLGAEGEGWPILARGLDRAAVLLSAEAVGVASHVIEIAVAYAKERQQFGRAIGGYQAISHKLANMLLSAESAKSHVFYAAWALEEGTPDARLAAATAKAAAADAARICANDGIQVHGGIGFTWEHDMHLYFRRAKFCELYLGDASAWRERIASLLAS
jgi:alkylation response protein AidB-like acyl-CoA dehydrogenase